MYWHCVDRVVACLGQAELDVAALQSQPQQGLRATVPLQDIAEVRAPLSVLLGALPANRSNSLIRRATWRLAAPLLLLQDSWVSAKLFSASRPSSASGSMWSTSSCPLWSSRSMAFVTDEATTGLPGQ